MRNDEFELPERFYSVSHIEYIIKRLYRVHHKKHETLTTNPPIHIYINRINDILVFIKKDEYKLELQTPETMKLFGSTKRLIDKTKNGEN